MGESSWTILAGVAFNALTLLSVVMHLARTGDPEARADYVDWVDGPPAAAMRWMLWIALGIGAVISAGAVIDVLRDGPSAGSYAGLSAGIWTAVVSGLALRSGEFDG